MYVSAAEKAITYCKQRGYVTLARRDSLIGRLTDAAVLQLHNFATVLQIYSWVGELGGAGAVGFCSARRENAPVHFTSDRE